MKVEGWQDRFWVAVDEARQTPFEWGVNDCVLFAAKVATSISDRDYVSDARMAFQWSSAADAATLIQNGLRGPVESVLGPMQPWTTLSQGDLVLILDDEGRECLAVHDGCQLIGKHQLGIRPIPMRCALGGWRVE